MDILLFYAEKLYHKSFEKQIKDVNKYKNKNANLLKINSNISFFLHDIKFFKYLLDKIKDMGFNIVKIKLKGVINMANVQKKEEIQKEILDQAYAYYEEVKKTGDYEKFNLRMRGLFRSYGMGTTEKTQQAMLEIISKKPETDIEREIIGGNYGLATQAMQQKETKEVAETAKKIAEQFGEKAAKAYLKGNDKCIVWAVASKQEAGKGVDKAFETIGVILGA